jgi:hypothetical protein
MPGGTDDAKPMANANGIATIAILNPANKSSLRYLGLKISFNGLPKYENNIVQYL